MDELEGRITRWFDEKGFGFAKVEGEPEDFFVWGDDVPATEPAKGTKIRFTPKAGKTGQRPRATKITVVE